MILLCIIEISLIAEKFQWRRLHWPKEATQTAMESPPSVMEATDSNSQPSIQVSAVTQLHQSSRRASRRLVRAGVSSLCRRCLTGGWNALVEFDWVVQRWVGTAPGWSRSMWLTAAAAVSSV